MKSQISVSQTYISAFNKFKSGDYKSSINYCQKALVIEKNSLVYHLLGVSFARLKLYNDAIYNIKEAINILPSSKIYIDLGDIYRELKDYKNAIDFYKLALKLEPENSNAYYSTATILHKIGNFSSALKMLVNALTYDDLLSALLFKASLTDPTKRTYSSSASSTLICSFSPCVIVSVDTRSMIEPI
jgi:tetratricopeptide (TPR) repeat protein